MDAKAKEPGLDVRTTVAMGAVGACTLTLGGHMLEAHGGDVVAAGLAVATFAAGAGTSAWALLDVCTAARGALVRSRVLEGGSQGRGRGLARGAGARRRAALER